MSVVKLPSLTHKTKDRGFVLAHWMIGVHENGDHYHDHDDYELDYNPELDGLWQADNVKLISVGIDIGSSGTQIIFSRIHMQRLGEQLSSRYCVVARELLYQSPISLTPYAPNLLIDASALAEIIDDAYRCAALVADQVDTGAVILTGEALRRENARAIADILSARGGQFVCTMAGHHIEAMLAGYGSGAAWISNERGIRILNIDIGGGTTKLALVEGGRVIATAALHVGGRLHVFDAQRRLIRLEPAGRSLAAAAGLDWSLGTTVTEAEVELVAGWMVDAVLSAVASVRPRAGVEDLFLTEGLPSLEDIGGVMFSGGVSEYVYGHETRDFGDMGRAFGQQLARRLESHALPWPLLPAGAGIRATALGLSEYSVQLSGNTIYISDPDALLPRRNLQVIEPTLTLNDRIDPVDIAAAITEYLHKYEMAESDGFALAIRWSGLPSHARIANLAAGIALGLAHEIAAKRPIHIVLDGDIARTLGSVLHDEFHVEAPLLVVDGVLLSDFDYIDFGRLRQESRTVPVTIKSLLFAGSTQDARTDNGTLGRNGREKTLNTN